jgi:uncharacterized protein
MGRILFWLVLGVLAYVAYRWWRQQQRGESPPARSGPPRDHAEPMVSCAVCGLNVPRSEALLAGPSAYCCEEHRRQGGSEA